ncbi:hypothetical protein [Pseudomonas syringae]|uniref:hypothetical protein n=1 Tax=Pseudomonas syringae TaxID=317 RepID=UPI001F28B82B|nr:hypothetical protein [Pseudomonas syringae]MCF5702120.1 hypothetical protein [Pseudomonas syringae]
MLATKAPLLEFCVRPQTRPPVEMLLTRQVNESVEHLHRGKARRRVVLDASR